MVGAGQNIMDSISPQAIKHTPQYPEKRCHESVTQYCIYTVWYTLMECNPGIITKKGLYQASVVVITRVKKTRNQMKNNIGLLNTIKNIWSFLHPELNCL